MRIDTDNMVTQSMANRDFRKVCRIADKYSFAMILRYAEPRYILIDFDKLDEAMDKLGFDLYLKKQTND